MRIKKYRPAFFEGFEDEFYVVNSREELMECELIKSAVGCGGEVCFSYQEDATSHIMLVIDNPEEERGCEWWVVAIITNHDDALTLKGWLPDWKQTIRKYEEKNAHAGSHE
jgi:hypothetical protein